MNETQHPHLFAFIMAGGSGERFWPMSRARTPKHLLRLLGDQTLLEATVRRLEGVIPNERIFVLTNEAQRAATLEAVPFLPPGNILCEPAKRDTAPACALATAVARSLDPEAVCLLLPADAMIADLDTFRRQVRDALDTASTEHALFTFGIPPTHAATGFGYLELGPEGPKAPRGSTVQTVRRFVEKPDATVARAYFEGGRHAWNAGIFLWKAADFLSEARRQQPALADFIEGMTPGDRDGYLAEHFPALPKISVDYAIMENAKEVAAIVAEFDWDDVGTWTALPAHLGMDAHGNTTRGPVVTHASERNIALSNGRTIALCGVSDLVVVETPDAILVCHRDAVQHVKNLQPHLPESLR